MTTQLTTAGWIIKHTTLIPYDLSSFPERTHTTKKLIEETKTLREKLKKDGMLFDTSSHKTENNEVDKDD